MLNVTIIIDPRFLTHEVGSLGYKVCSIIRINLRHNSVYAAIAGWVWDKRRNIIDHSASTTDTDCTVSTGVAHRFRVETITTRRHMSDMIHVILQTMATATTSCCNTFTACGKKWSNITLCHHCHAIIHAIAMMTLIKNACVSTTSLTRTSRTHESRTHVTCHGKQR